MRLSDRISSWRHVAMTALVIAASLEFALAHTSYHLGVKIVKVAAAAVLAWAFYLDQRIVYANWQMRLSRKMLLHVALLLLALLGFQATEALIAVLVRETGRYGPDAAQELETALQMAAYPLMTAALCLGTDGYAPWLRRHSKHLTMLLYLYVWIWFGSYYYYMADRTMGDDFVFSEQAEIQTTLRGIYADERYDDADEYRLKEILEKGQYKKDYLKLDADAYLTRDETGADWGGIYENQFAREGYAYYTFRKAAEPLVVSTDRLDFDDLPAWRTELGKRYAEVDVALYKGDGTADGTGHEVRYAEEAGDRASAADGGPAKTLKLYFAEGDYERYMQIFANAKQDRRLGDLIAASHTLPDGKFLELYVGMNGYTNYRVEDFWYFSAITITTLGFGDITPNSGPVKVGVMIETLLGVLLVGIYVSLVSHKKRGSD
ncbi:two pore domain potassium channel family protein [Paenibacillus sp. MWE-103]|uniref:Two pore domain potassium channel family protein n=1 Tax=Paenibacillus artemisiicola TaxID=1172618 RepID=A0ABS3WDD7_9BACL|nr:potassium channel family protein [Paenibacillus artemisiicola]MBO7746359.1 two pore domain potassium channel family protein [Paenibacillus artemisiicola]